MQVQAIGVPWYKKENFKRLLEVFEDSDNLHASYDEWIVAAESFCKDLEEKGSEVFRVDIDPDEFPKWCKEHGEKVDAKGRSRYAGFFAAQNFSPKKS